MGLADISGSRDAYQEALAYLYGLTDWERRTMDRQTRETLLLARPAALLSRLGNPERRYLSILVAGTKGKGSTAAMLASILRAAGYRTGLYSQPHLHTYRERIRVDGSLITRDQVVSGIERIRPHTSNLERECPELGSCTTYEVGTALALDHFAGSAVDVAVLEVGLGGRLDATNVVDAGLSIVSSISYDHTAILGETLAEIAAEKAAIFKPGKPALSAPQRPEAREVIERTAAARDAPFGLGGRDWLWSGSHDAFQVTSPAAVDGLWPEPWSVSGLRVPLLGAHQLENAASAVAAAHVLASSTSAPYPIIPAAAIVRGLEATRWPARFEVVPLESSGLNTNPMQDQIRYGARAARDPSARLAGHGAVVVIDGAHNGDSATRLASALRTHLDYERLWLVLGVGVDKDLTAIVTPLAPLAAGAWTAAAHHPRSRAAPEVAAALTSAGVSAQPVPHVAAALAQAVAACGPRDAVCVTGSLFVAAEAREALGLVPGDERDPDEVGG
jgi:dihydrofolate synthase / folylpolyglutamate synthase